MTSPTDEPRPPEFWLDERLVLAEALADVGRAVRDAVRSSSSGGDQDVVRTEGGDDVYGVDERAEHTLLDELAAHVAGRWPGTLVMEGFDEPQPVGGAGGPWRYLVDPVDGTRPYLAGINSAWVLIGAGRNANTLEDLEVGVAVEIPLPGVPTSRVAWACTGSSAHAVIDDLVGGAFPVPLMMEPTMRTDPNRSFVTVVRLLAGDHGPIGLWADRHLAGLEVYDHLLPCGGQHLFDVASGRASAVLDPRPIFNPAGMHTHPYDLAALVLYRAAGVIVEALPPGPLAVPLDPHVSVAYAAYANHALAIRLRPEPGSLALPSPERALG